MKKDINNEEWVAQETAGRKFVVVLMLVATILFLIIKYIGD